MGSMVSGIFDSYKEKPAKVLMLGIDSAGKTTILAKLMSNDTVATIPTVGFSVEDVSPCKGLSLTMWDVGGQTKLRPLWKHYFSNTDGLIYVVDSSDTDRFEESRNELFAILQPDALGSIPLVIFANKQDLPNAVPADELSDAFLMDSIKSEWHIQPCCSLKGEGIVEGLKILSKMLKEKKKKKS